MWRRTYLRTDVRTYKRNLESLMQAGPSWVWQKTCLYVYMCTTFLSSQVSFNIFQCCNVQRNICLSATLLFDTRCSQKLCNIVLFGQVQFNINLCCQVQCYIILCCWILSNTVQCCQEPSNFVQFFQVTDNILLFCQVMANIVTSEQKYTELCSPVRLRFRKSISGHYFQTLRKLANNYL